MIGHGYVPNKLTAETLRDSEAGKGLTRHRCIEDVLKTLEAQALSESSFKKIWDNEEDADYDAL